MAFDLRTNNLVGPSLIDQPAGVLAGSYNYIEEYTYAEKYQPELIPQLHMRNGRGKITGFVKMTGSESNYTADTIQHMEEGRLMGILKNVAVTANTFTSPTVHNLRPKDTVKISDGVKEFQATVQTITSPTVFVATNDGTGAFSFVGNVDIIADFSNKHLKGSGQYEKGKRWNPTPYTNYTHILKDTYEISKSDMVTQSWVMTSDGPKWYNHEMSRTGDKFDNLEELTQIFHERATDASASVTAGSPKGLKGVVQQIEERGNIGNEYITTLLNLSNIARRAKQQGTCRAFTVWSDHTQMRYFREMMSGLNASYVNGANYGVFQNSMDMALKLDFSSVLVDGVTFHFTPWAVLEDPSLLGSAKFLNTSIACLIVPAGETYSMEEGNTVAKPYMTFRYRSEGAINRRKEISIYGLNQPHPQRLDVMTADYLTEMTNQVIGANNFFAIRRGVFYV
jgi:hypothetical protein